MALITLQVIDGFERGRVYGNLDTPVTIGREDENTIQLNDDRVSRFHAKIQEDAGRLILTDLDSTNGTRVNGHPVQVRILHIGDHICFGRSLLLLGSQEEIANQLRQARADAESGIESGRTLAFPTDERSIVEPIISDEFGSIGDFIQDRFEESFLNGPPELPTELKALQVAQLSDMVAYVHEQIANIINLALEDQTDPVWQMRLDWATWQRLMQLEMNLASYLRQIADPDQPGG